MMRALLWILLSAFPLLCTSQYLVEGSSGAMFSREDFAKSVPTRIFPDVIENDTCSRRAFAYELLPVDGEESGFVLGSNASLDLSKIQRLIVPGGGPYVVTEVGVAFAEADARLADYFVSVRIYNDLVQDTLIGELLATSDSVRVGDIALPDSLIRFTTFTFPNRPIVQRDSFWVHIELSDIYRAPPGGNVGIFHTVDGCGDGNNVFEQVALDGTYVYTPINRRWRTTDSTFLNAEMFVYAIVDDDLSVSTRQPIADYRLTVSPNPTVDRFTVAANSGITGGRYRGSITDMQGRILRSTPYQFFNSSVQFDWSLADLPAGLYLYHIDGPQGRQSGKVVKR